MGKDLNKVFDFIDGTKQAQKSGNKNDPLSDYIAYEKALDMEKQLEQVIWETRGSKGVATFKRMRAQATERDRQSKYASIKRRNQISKPSYILEHSVNTYNSTCLLDIQKSDG